MDKERVLNFAKLARIELQNDEAESLSNEFETILNYVKDVKKVDTTNVESKDNKNKAHLYNVLREDKSPHESGFYTKEILEQAPAREGDYIKVKKIL